MTNVTLFVVGYSILTGELVCAGTGTRLWLRTQRGVGKISYFKGFEQFLGLESKHFSKKFVHQWYLYLSHDFCSVTFKK